MPRTPKPGDGAGKPAPSELPYEEQRAHCREAALRLLTVRERSESELRSRLRKKGYRPDIIDEVLARLSATGLQSDQRFAERYAEGAVTRGIGSSRIRMGLSSKGVDRELAASTAAEKPEAEEERARALARQRAARMSSLEPAVRVRRLLGLLARRGFPADVCRRVATEAGGGFDDDDPGGRSDTNSGKFQFP